MFKQFYLEITNIFNSDNPLIYLLIEIKKVFLFVWNHKILETADKQNILVSNIVISLILFIIGTHFVKKLNIVLKSKLSKFIDESSALNSLERLSYYFFMLIMVVFVLDLSRVPLTIFTVIGTTLALGIGLGSQNIVNNFISGLIIMIERPIKIGDIVEIKNIAGQVTNIGARCTSIKTSKNINVLIPNSSILQDTIVNWTLEDSTLKISFELLLEDKISIEEIDEIIKDILIKHPHVMKSQEPKVLIKSLNSVGYDLEVQFWIDLASKANSNNIIDNFYRSLIPELKSRNIKVIDKFSLPTA